MPPAPAPPRAAPRPLVPLVLLLAVLPAWAGELQVDVLDVGQGDAILLRAPGGATLLVDGGPGRADVAAELAGRGITRLDWVVISHPHEDHIGGLDDVFRAVEVTRVLDGAYDVSPSPTWIGLQGIMAGLGIPRQVARAGTSFDLGDEVEVEVLSPGGTLLRGIRSDANANSVVLRVEHGEDCLYLAGDSEALTEARIVRAGLEPCEVLKVAHHGSAYSTSDRFIDALRPEVALVSVGAHNRYGHPSAGTLGRLERRGVAVYRTDVSRTLRVLSSGRGVEVLEDIGPARPAGGAAALPAREEAAASADGATHLPVPLPIGPDPGYRCGLEVAP